MMFTSRNPILAAIKKDRAWGQPLLQDYRNAVKLAGMPIAYGHGQTESDIFHARKVLTRLANLANQPSTR